MEIEKTPTYQETNDQIAPIGPMSMVTRKGIITAYDAPGITSLEIRNEDGSVRSAAIVVYDPSPEVGAGLIVQMSADSARRFGASLIGIANLIDGGANG